jgi:ABC-type Fe3+ transport system substrate-binding protein
MQAKGVPIEFLPGDQLREGSYLSAAAGTVAVFNRAPNPNALKVYLNYLLSKEGQLELAKKTGRPTRRLDIPQNFIHKSYLPKQGVKYHNHDKVVIQMKEEVDNFIKSVITR